MNQTFPFRPPVDPRRRQVEILFEGGWTKPRDIRRLMALDGTTAPTLFTIRRWTDPEFDERCRKASRDCMRRKRALARVENTLQSLTEADMWDLALEVTR